MGFDLNFCLCFDLVAMMMVGRLFMLILWRF